MIIVVIIDSICARGCNGGGGGIFMLLFRVVVAVQIFSRS